MLWLLGENGLRKYDRMEATEPAEISRAFPAGGFFVTRNSWEPDASYLMIDCGEHGFLNCGHAHADALSFVFSFEGEPIFIDSGTYCYTADTDARQYYRSSAAHNCLTVNGRSSSTPGEPFTWKSVARATLIEWSENSSGVHRFRGSHDGFREQGVEYEREILLQRDKTLILHDAVKSENPCSYELNFILSPKANAEIHDNSVKIVYPRNGTPCALRIATTITADDKAIVGQWRTEPCFISGRYGSKVGSNKIIYSIRAEGQLKISNFFSKALV
jgi:hypothetical protein